MSVFHPLLIEAVRDARPLNDAEIESFAESIRDQIRADQGATAQQPLFLWARRAVEGSRVS